MHGSPIWSVLIALSTEDRGVLELWSSVVDTGRGKVNREGGNSLGAGNSLAGLSPNSSAIRSSTRLFCDLSRSALSDCGLAGTCLIGVLTMMASFSTSSLSNTSPVCDSNAMSSVVWLLSPSSLTDFLRKSLGVISS